MRLQDILDAGGQCAWSGVERRPLITLSDVTQQGAGSVHGTPGDYAAGAVRGLPPGRLPLMPASMAGAIKFGRGK